MSKRVALLLIAMLTVSSLIMVESASAQSIPKPSVPEFTLKYVDHSYDVPPTNISSTDPYTNKTTITAIPSHHVKSMTVDATIRNNGGSYYNFRYKPHYIDNWSYYPFNPDLGSYIVPAAYDLSSIYPASTSDYTIISLTFLPNIPEGGQVDVQVQALIGDFDKQPSGMLGPAVPNFPFVPTYDFTFRGTTSDWSNTQTLTIPSSTPLPGATTNEISQMLQSTAIIGAIIAVVVVSVVLLVYWKKRKRSA
jgi:hypothetical protein